MFRLVVDTNVLFTFYWSNSVTRELITRKDFALVSPEYALVEINRHKKEILNRARITLSEFNQITAEMATYIDFVPIQDYQMCLKDSCDIPDVNDVDFIALALKTGYPLWSNDTALKKQAKVPVLTTEDLLKLLTQY